MQTQLFLCQSDLKGFTTPTPQYGSNLVASFDEARLTVALGKQLVQIEQTFTEPALDRDDELQPIPSTLKSITVDSTKFIVPL